MRAAMQHSPQKIPPAGPAREALRETGQFWTPAWLARVMVSWVLAPRPAVLFDPAVGPGTFFAAARDLGFSGELAGYELDPAVLGEGYRLGLRPDDLAGVAVGDFLRAAPEPLYPAIVSNPPYLRHHRLSEERKRELRRLAATCLGFPLDGRTGLHVFFLLKCLRQLAPGGRLAFLLPADTFEGVSAPALWERLCQKYRLDAVLTFDEAAAPFPGVDTNVLVVLISQRPPAARVRWGRVWCRDPDSVLQLLAARDTPAGASPVATFHQRDLREALATGLSRPPQPPGQAGVRLGTWARVLRGIATGANEFFFLTARQMREHGLDPAFFRRAVGRTRDCPGDILTREDLERLDAAGRPTWLLDLGTQDRQALPAPLRAYLERGEQAGLPQRALVRTRRPWYRMEQRQVPPLLFAYLGRRACRFILNQAEVVPLTGFLCVYPFDAAPAHVHRLWQALNHPATLKNLSRVGKSYGGGAIKVEPRQLEALEIPHPVLEAVGLRPPAVWHQTMLLESMASPG
jgi:hypothetical protein